MKIEIEYDCPIFNMGINNGYLFLQIINNGQIVDYYERPIISPNLHSILKTIFHIFPLDFVNMKYLSYRRNITINDGEIIDGSSNVIIKCQKLSEINSALPNILTGLIPLI